ncbi:MAG: chromosome segregation protein SMC [Planctomycetes bacterium]|nr:chromosome segregation protein SMC [Planctomycetota bacterium]
MRLQRLELFGFKSFADRTVFEFGENALTGVVGPNGCGKSNVVDSVRWVLGEQRPTSMRGAEMTDVIFKGSASRPGLSVAEVTLILDNQAGGLEGRGAEVSITRRVFKSGEGEYLLDGQKVRLKDVREMLYDTGLGSRGYSVLEQGKIDAVLSANPLERRRIFEEAAGISRYRQRRVETELRLKRVAEDMARLDDVVGELSSRVRSLKIQAGKAERWAEAKADWSNQRTRLSRHRLAWIDRDLDRLRAELAELETRATALRAEREAAEGDVDARELERAALVSEIERLLSEIGRVSGDGRMLDERRAQLSSRVASWQHAAKEEAERAEKLATALAERERELARLVEERAALEARAKSAGDRAREKSAALRELEKSYREKRGEVERQNDAVLSLLRARTEAENRVRSLTESRGPAAERAKRVEERLGAARAQNDAVRAEESAATARQSEAQTALAAHEEHRRELAQRMAEVGLQVTTLEREKNQLELERAKAQSRIEFLLARERDLEELTKGARRVLESVEKRAEPIAAEALLGLLADHLRTETRFARALDAVIHARGGALVVRDAASARAVAGWLKSTQAGQVGLLFASAEGAAPVEPLPAEFTEEERELVLGALRGEVAPSAGSERLADLLLADVWVVRDLDAALALAPRHPRARFVTLEGELVDAAGLLAGTRDLVQGAVGRRSSAAELSAQVEALAGRIAGLDARLADLVKERIGLQKDWERSSQELEQRPRALNEAGTELATARARLRDLSAGERALEQESQAVLAEMARLERDLAQETSKLEEARVRFEVENAKLASADSERVGLEEQKDLLGREESSAQVEAARARTELEGVARRVSDLERVQNDQRLEHDRAQRIHQESEASAKNGAAECEALAAKSAELLAVRAEYEEKVGGLRTLSEGGRDAIEGLRRRADQVTRALESASASLSDARLSEQRLAMARTELLVRAQEELHQDELALKADFQPEAELESAEALDALENEVRELKGKLEKLGPVNLEAMTELSEVGGRLEFLQNQRADLDASRQQLAEAVSTIDSESKRLFLETFEAVRTNFQRIFRQLFGGGRAEIVLEEGADVLEAGVDIIARPPGRELLSIGLLSGGQRTLTALALLFAVFEARPSPFCLLDEVDAALDEANVERFLQMLAGYRATTQFVVVTHNKSTMTACDSLYGVTMETKGVSRQVSVELGDVERWADRPGAPAAARGKPAPETTVDPESGEPVVELVPAAGDRPAEGPARRRVSRAARAELEAPLPEPTAAPDGGEVASASDAGGGPSDGAPAEPQAT